MDKSKIAVSVAILLSIVSTFVAFGRPNVITKEIVEKSVGALTGPDIPYTYLSVGGIRREYRETTMRTATTTLCAMQAPAATSSLVSTSFQITTGTSTAATIDIATSTTAFATTTNLVSARSIASGGLGYGFWSPVGGAQNDSIVGPSEWVVVKTAGAGLSGYTYSGQCSATFEVL